MSHNTDFYLLKTQHSLLKIIFYISWIRKEVNGGKKHKRYLKYYITKYGTKYDMYKLYDAKYKLNHNSLKLQFSVSGFIYIIKMKSKLYNVFFSKSVLILRKSHIYGTSHKKSIALKDKTLNILRNY